ncbi:uncharacterized protein E0L32_008545 [Thyridium curvatum]|uniref:LysM domain-containing protein n=1 Tax=Thyridium curvatum TaxID=1093900 RepID=A0A507AJJ1_9PEZI|nr:uncharacterized protein E0L32_008545 [Thyridium curvatum]TPX10495.1 hypothetical protein E0L32_008545 [Thyridium curvatum]
MSSTTALVPDPDSAARPRNRRLVSTAGASTAASVFSSADTSPSQSRGVSPIPSARVGRPFAAANGTRGSGSASSRAKSTGAGGKGLLDTTTWSPSWASVTEFASSLLGDAYKSDNERSGSRPRKPIRRTNPASAAGTWGPAPPDKSRPRAEDIAAGSLAEREAALKAVKTASVLESHPGVNGGLDVAGKFKRRSSEEDLQGAAAQKQEVEEYLVYIHHVQPTDTYAGIVLKYRCREDAFRKANGLWSRDNIQVRKWLALPVDACEIRGRPSEGPSYYSRNVDLLAPTPGAGDEGGDDFFASSAKNRAPERPKQEEEEPAPWAHVKWVTVDGFAEPVEIGRVSRRSLGFFPPRRKKSLHTVSTLSTPRQSLDVPASGSPAGDLAVGSPGSTRSRSLSSAGRGPLINAYGSSAPTTTRSRGGSGGDDIRPLWMRRPGGVGTMGKGVRMPGPDKDAFNSWAKKHLPGLNIENLPSMSVMGSETAHFGFMKDASGIVESPFEDGRDVSTALHQQQGNGLDKAAAAVETWLRTAFAKKPGTPSLGPRRARADQQGLGDLIELEDTNSDDGRGGGGAFDISNNAGLLRSVSHASTARSDGASSAASRGRNGASHMAKGKKAD